jgi:GNAT superfamily N-acetyltransferase
MGAHDPLVVRVADVGDAADRLALARLRFAWRAGERGEEGLGEEAFGEALSTWMLEHRDTHLPFLAERHGEPIAMVWLALVERVPGPGRFVRRSAYVQSTYVVAAERSAGVGTRLMEVLLAHARGLGLDYLAVHPSDRAFPFYRRLGFQGTDGLLELPS